MDRQWSIPPTRRDRAFTAHVVLRPKSPHKSLGSPRLGDVARGGTSRTPPLRVGRVGTLTRDLEIFPFFLFFLPFRLPVSPTRSLRNANICRSGSHVVGLSCPRSPSHFLLTSSVIRERSGRLQVGFQTRGSGSRRRMRHVRGHHFSTCRWRTCTWTCLAAHVGRGRGCRDMLGTCVLGRTRACDVEERRERRRKGDKEPPPARP